MKYRIGVVMEDAPHAWGRDLLPVTVEANSVKEALKKAADVPLSDFFYRSEDDTHD